MKTNMNNTPNAYDSDSDDKIIRQMIFSDNEDKEDKDDAVAAFAPHGGSR